LHETQGSDAELANILGVDLAYVDSLVVHQTTLVYCTLMLIVTINYLISELDLGACNNHVRPLQTMERELRSVGRACTSPRQGVDRCMPFQLQQGGLNEATKS
jgi:hypothetical protein